MHITTTNCGVVSHTNIDHILCYCSTPRARWAFIEKLSGYSRGQVFEPAVTVAIGCFYIAVLLFFQSLWEYHAMMTGLAITG